jgi:hypothetical protein
MDRVGKFGFAQLTLEIFPIDFGYLIDSDRVQLGSKPLSKALKMSVFRTSDTVAYCYQRVTILCFLHAYPAFQIRVIFLALTHVSFAIVYFELRFNYLLVHVPCL